MLEKEKKNYSLGAEMFEKSISVDPKSVYARNALRGLKQVCQFDLNDEARYLNFRANAGLPDVSTGEKDALTFESSKSVYIKKDFPKAIVKFSGYLKDFPNGMFQTDANYMLAESYFAQGDKAASLPYFDHVIDAPYGEWTEEALYKASSIYMENEEYQKAIGRFHLLAEKTEYDVYEKDALVGLMTAYNALDDFENTAKYAQIVEGNKLVENSNKFQARLLLGNALFKSHKYDSAYSAYQRIAGQTQKVMAAEAIYQMAYIKYLKEDYKTSQELTIQLLQEFSNYPFGIQRVYSFIR